VGDGATLAARVPEGGARAVARALSLVENGGAEAEALMAALPAASHEARIVGVTGGFGAGKSTLVEALGVRLLEMGRRVAVVAVDPSSPFTGGALLGDRVRMNRLASEGGFVRSMATRGVLGGLSAATADAVQVLEAAGYQWILVETVGVGQDEVDVAAEVDTVVVLLPPGSGDEIQTAKAGLLEIGDIFVVNKADQPGAAAVVAALEAMLDLARQSGWRSPVLQTVARTGEGVGAVIDAIDSHARRLEQEGRREEQRRQRLRRRFSRVVQAILADAARRQDEATWARLMAEVEQGRLRPVEAARQLVDRLMKGAPCG